MIRAMKLCDHGRKSIVIAEDYFFDRDAVVFVYNRDRAELEELFKRVREIRPALVAFKVAAGYEQLTYRVAVFGKEFVIP